MNGKMPSSGGADPLERPRLSVEHVPQQHHRAAHGTTSSSAIVRGSWRSWRSTRAAVASVIRALIAPPPLRSIRRRNASLEVVARRSARAARRGVVGGQDRAVAHQQQLGRSARPRPSRGSRRAASSPPSASARNVLPTGRGAAPGRGRRSARRARAARARRAAPSASDTRARWPPDSARRRRGPRARPRPTVVDHRVDVASGGAEHARRSSAGSRAPSGRRRPTAPASRSRPARAAPAIPAGSPSTRHRAADARSARRRSRASASSCRSRSGRAGRSPCPGGRRG